MAHDKCYQALAQLLGARERCRVDGNKQKWFESHTAAILKIVNERFPSGSGFDNGTKIDLDASSEEKIVFTTAYHHMDDNGMYDGWTDHVVTVRPSLAFGFRLTIRGRDRNQIKEYIHEAFHEALSSANGFKDTHVVAGISNGQTLV